MPIRADILTQLADVLAELYYNQGSIETMATTAGLNLARIAFYPRALDTWVALLKEAEVHDRTLIILERARTEKPVYEPLLLACQAYADWVTAGRPMTEPVHAPRRLLRAPPPPDTFAGRTAELEKLTETLLRSQTAAVSAAVPGMGGVGKTTLALKLASDLAPHFPGGVVWLEAGYGAGQSDLVDRLARMLSIDLAQEPLVEKRAAILQSVLGSRGRVLVIQDDLWDIDLGRWAGKALWPADRVLLVTSRDVALCRALCNHVQRLDVLPEAEALELLANLLGPPGRHEGAARTLVRLLDGYPLALEIAARRCDNGVDDLPWMVRRLQGGPTLGELKLPGQESRESSVEASLALSYGDLDTKLQQQFRALGVFAPAPFDLAGPAAVWGVESVDEAEEIARPLVRRALLVQELVGDEPVYRQHMLLRAYAWALLEQAGELDAAAGRHMAYYQALPGQQAENWPVAEAFWEQIQQGWQHAWRAGPGAALSYHYATRVFLERRNRHAAHIEWTSTLLKLPAVQLSDRDRASTLTDIGEVYFALGETQQALACYEQALPLRRQVGDQAGEAATLNNIGNVCAALGERQQALAYLEQALLLQRKVGGRAGEAHTLSNIGSVYNALGEKQQALAYYQQALLLSRQVGDRAGEAATLNNIGSVYAALGEKQQALAYYEQALPLMRQVGDRFGEARTFNNIGSVYNALGEKQQALAYYEQALLLSRQVHDRSSEASTLNNIGRVYDALGEEQQALAYYEQALPLWRQVGDRSGEAKTLYNIGRVYDALGEKQQALAYYAQALPLRRLVGDRSGEARTLNDIGNIYAALGDKPRALELYEQALPLKRRVGDCWSERITHYNMAMVYQSLDRLDEAEAQLSEVVALDEAIGHPDLESDRAALEHVRRLRQNQPDTVLDADNNEGDALSLDELLALVRQAREGNRGLAEQLTPFLQALASNPDIPAEVQTLGAILLQLVAGATSPDLNGLPAELVETIRLAFDLPEV